MAPASVTAFAVAMNVMSGTMTSSPASDAQPCQGDRDGRGAAGHGDGVADAKELGELLFERRRDVSFVDVVARQHVLDQVVLVGADFRLPPRNLFAHASFLLRASPASIRLTCAMHVVAIACANESNRRPGVDAPGTEFETLPARS